MFRLPLNFRVLLTRPAAKEWPEGAQLPCDSQIFSKQSLLLSFKMALTTTIYFWGPFKSL